jgi:hypothetical protein
LHRKPAGCAERRPRAELVEAQLAEIVYGYAALEMFEQTALGALTIVVIGLIPVLLLHEAVAGGAPEQHVHAHDAHGDVRSAGPQRPLSVKFGALRIAET